MIKKGSASDPSAQERRWTSGSYAAAAFALLFLLFNLGTMIWSTSLPTDGWFLTGDLVSDPPHVVFSQNILPGPSPIEKGDQLVAINGRSLTQLAQTQYAFLKLVPPDWPDGTRLHYDVLRGSQRLAIEVPVRRASLWEYYAGLIGKSSGSGLVQMATGLFIFIIALIVFLLRPSNRAAHALLFLGIGFLPILSNDTAPTIFYPSLPVSIPFDTWTLMINPSIMYLVLAFPTPKAALRRFPILTVLLIYLSWPIAFNTAYLLHLEDMRGYLNIAYSIYPVQVILMMLITLGALIHTALTVRDPVGRSQFKWMVVGISGFVFIGVGGWLVSAYLFPETMTEGNWLVTALGWFLLPVCLAIAITRYRLFDIDVIIRRTLVYGALSITLGLVYFGSVLMLQSLFQTIAGQSQSPTVIVLSTLAIVVLFAPLRRRIQDIIDRRFYRHKYDAEKALAGFTSTTQEVVGLEPLIDALLGVVDETMQPEGASLWLRVKR